MCQPTGWDAQPHGWDDETLADRLEVYAGRLEVLCYTWFKSEPTYSERHAYSERLSKLQGKGFGIPRVLSWNLFYNYNFEETLKNKIKYEYLHDDGDVFIDYSWEKALSIYGDVYPEWCLEFFSTMYFDRGVDRTKLMTEKCIWFRLCGVKKLEVDDNLFNHKAFWQKIKQPTCTNPRTSLIKEPLYEDCA
ncbi:hypothetical protein Tco_1119996 [Tanacetum coccineum]